MRYVLSLEVHVVLKRVTCPMGMLITCELLCFNNCMFILKGVYMPKRSKNPKKIKSDVFIVDESTLPPRAKVLLEELSRDLNLPKELIATLAVEMCRMYKGKV